MTKKLNVKIHKGGDNNRVILDCIGSYNAGKVHFTARDLEGWLQVQRAFLPGIGAKYCLIKDVTESDVYHVSEDGETFTISLEWVEVHELQPNESDIKSMLHNPDDLENLFN